MHLFVILMLLASLAITPMSVITANTAQSVPGTTWVKKADNPLMSIPPWSSVSILFDGSGYQAWYARNPPLPENKIYYTTSCDGINWAPSQVIYEGIKGWETYIGNCRVVHDGTTYFIFYGTADASNRHHIGVLTSSDGITNLIDYPEPILSPGPAGVWDGWSVGPHHVLLDESTFYMWYGGESSSSGGHLQVGLATSFDGLQWTRHSDNPVITPGVEWEGREVRPGPVIKEDNTYYMWYLGSTAGESRIGLATSTDGATWIKYDDPDDGNPNTGDVVLKGDPDAWDELHVSAETVIRTDSGYTMWYNGFGISNGEYLTQTGLAFSGASPISDTTFKICLSIHESGYSILDVPTVTIKIPEYGVFRINAREGPIEQNGNQNPDLDATDGSATLFIPAEPRVPRPDAFNYKVWIIVNGEPHQVISWGESWRFDVLWQPHSVSGPPRWNGPWTTYFNTGYNSWTGPPWTNEGIPNLEMYWIPSSSHIPNADANGPYLVNEGTPVIFDASTSTDPNCDVLEYRWDLDNNGVWDTGWSIEPTVPWTWVDDWDGTVAVEVSDNELTDTAVASVSVGNVAPSADIGEDLIVNEGDRVDFIGVFTDPGILDTHTIHWDFGDSQSATRARA
jgi:hypothetical protein